MSRVSPVQVRLAAVDDGGVDGVDGVGVGVDVVGTGEEFARAAVVGPGVASAAAAAAAADAGEHGGSAADIGVEAHAEAVVDGAVAMAAAAAAAAAGVAKVRGADEQPKAAAAASRTWMGKLASRLVLAAVEDDAAVVGKVAGAGGIEAVAPAAALDAAAVAGSAAVGTRQLSFQGIPNLPTG